MKRIAYSIGLLALLVACNKTSQTITYPSEKFRDIPWSIGPVSDTSKFVLLRQNMGESVYMINGEKLSIGTEPIDSIRYVFFGKKLEQIHIYYTSAQKKYGEYLDVIIRRYCDAEKHKNPTTELHLNRENVVRSDSDKLVLDSIQKHFADYQKMAAYLEYKYGKCKEHYENGLYWDTSGLHISLDFTEIVFDNKAVTAEYNLWMKKSTDSIANVQNKERKSLDSLKVIQQRNNLKNELNGTL